ncbi:MAG: YraN family protein [Actinobacteria bacterium]|nr:MAG: YraN family protein [Actinomycetota bacterium]
MDVGAAGEQLAAAYLRRKGHHILATNYRCRMGELDIVSQDGGVLVFCEVKTRRGRSKGEGFESVTPRKQRRIRRLAEWFMISEYGEMRTCRFDVISLGWEGGRPRLLHLENAF